MMKTNMLWGSFRIAISIPIASLAASAVRSQSIYTQFWELTSWFVLPALFIWAIAIATTMRSFSLAINSTTARILSEGWARSGHGSSLFLEASRIHLDWYSMVLEGVPKRFSTERYARSTFGAPRSDFREAVVRIN